MLPDENDISSSGYGGVSGIVGVDVAPAVVVDVAVDAGGLYPIVDWMFGVDDWGSPWTTSVGSWKSRLLPPERIWMGIVVSGFVTNVRDGTTARMWMECVTDAYTPLSNVYKDPEGTTNRIRRMDSFGSGDL